VLVQNFTASQFLFVAILHNKQLFTAALPPIQGGEGQRSTIPSIPCQKNQLNKHKQTNKKIFHITSCCQSAQLRWTKVISFSSLDW